MIFENSVKVCYSSFKLELRVGIDESFAWMGISFLFLRIQFQACGSTVFALKFTVVFFSFKLLSLHGTNFFRAVNSFELVILVKHLWFDVQNVF